MDWSNLKEWDIPLNSIEVLIPDFSCMHCNEDPNDTAQTRILARTLHQT